MKTVYHAANPIDAQMTVDLLADAGIAAHVQGSFLVGGIGELPAGEMMRVWVDDGDLAAARTVLDRPAEPFDSAQLRLEVAPVLQRSWQRAWAALGVSDGDASLCSRLVEAYSDPQRSYHGLQHLQECIAQLDSHLRVARYPGEVEIALWFHDAVYEVREGDNEQRSAEWATQALQAAGVAQDAVRRVHDLVMVTRHDARPGTGDEALLVDVDLSILGAPAARFDQYEQQVREEYAWVPGWAFRRKRRALLEQFLARPAIYHTAPFVAAFESAARDNLRRSIARLRPWWSWVDRKD